MYKIVFMGTPEFSVPILEGLIQEENYEVIGVVTQPDRKVGRKKVVTPPPVKKKAVEHGIAVFQPEKLSGSEEMNQVLALEPDIIVTAAYGQYVPTKMLKAPKYKAVNVHASLLPKYRGAAPIHYALINGDRETGVTIMYMEKEMDAGDIISQRSLRIDPEDTVGTLFGKLSLIGRDLLLDTLPDIFSGTHTPTSQDLSEVTYSPMISREEEKIDWTKRAETIAFKVRGMNTFPGAYTLLKGQRFKIWRAEAVSQSSDKEPGTIVRLTNKDMQIQCGEQTVLSLKEVQPFGKPKMTIEDFLSGAVNHLEEGERFE
ncbi:methionyl-tRNA formyltransferase [Alkalibacterium thalassium]|uniref:Methionyl-tRNA formyltransferase n=1 Tax=Alkalibacterium thalassium TaxID=426701 RepID=A0A1G8X2L0_9LACT|nr:methionyl-tRNA formyltransferase [Alkalibacterium thalassium]SDJ84065.1 methionyl-tRNA formyltransferase [Alkalibacterium thalassium]